MDEHAERGEHGGEQLVEDAEILQHVPAAAVDHGGGGAGGEVQFPAPHAQPLEEAEGEERHGNVVQIGVAAAAEPCGKDPPHSPVHDEVLQESTEGVEELGRLQELTVLAPPRLLRLLVLGHRFARGSVRGPRPVLGPQNGGDVDEGDGEDRRRQQQLQATQRRHEVAARGVCVAPVLARARVEVQPPRPLGPIGPIRGIAGTPPRHRVHLDGDGDEDVDQRADREAGLLDAVEPRRKHSIHRVTATREGG